MTDFFDDLERELRRAHRRDTERHARSRVFDRRRLPGLPAAGLRTLVALAVVVALVAVVLTVGRESDVERPAAPPPSPTTGLGAQDGCLPSKWWKAPVVDEPIPLEIVSRLAIFRDPPPSGALPRDARSFLQARKLYRGAVTLRAPLETGARLRVVMIAADAISSTRWRGDYCAPPQPPTEPSICVAAFAPNNEHEMTVSGNRPVMSAGCFTIDEIEDANAWLGVTRRIVFGLAPDGVDRVTFDTAAGTQSLNISSNVFAGEIRSYRSAQHPYDTDARFAP